MTACTTLEFKKALDDFLAVIPDEPRIPGYTKFCRAASNSIVDMLEACREGLPHHEDLVDDHVGH